MPEVKLDDISLTYRAQAQPTDPITELRNIRDIRIEDHRSVVELRVPGSSGNILQEMGREPIRITFLGEMWGPDAKTTIQGLLDKYGAGKTLPFSSDIATLANVTNVVMEDLVLEVAAGKADYYTYRISLKEFVDPKSSHQQPPPSQAQQAQKDTDDDSDVRGIRGVVLGPDGKPKQGVNVNVKSDAGEWQLTTDANGKYRMHDPAEGTYTITVDAEGYENLKRTMLVKKDSS